MAFCMSTGLFLSATFISSHFAYSAAETTSSVVSILEWSRPQYSAQKML